MTTRTVLRGGLTFLAATQIAVGFWALLFPQSFFDIPWVGMRMHYNEHLMRDYGAMSLAMSVVLVAAVVFARRQLICIALTTYLVFAVSHFVIHFRMLHHLTPTEGTALMIGLGFAVAIPAALLALAVRLKEPRSA